MGDVVHALPALTDLRRAHPHALIDLATDERFAEIVGLHAGVDRVVPLALKRWKSRLSKRQTWGEIAAALRQLRAQPYDLVIDLQGLSKSAIVCWLAHGAQKMGPAARHCGEWLPPHLYDALLDPEPAASAVLRMRQFAALAVHQPLPGPADFGLRIGWQGQHAREVALVHGTAGAHKLWPASHWIELGRSLVAQGHTLVLPWGTEAEHARALEIAEGIGAVHCRVGARLSIAEWAQTLSTCRLVVGVDTGLTHLAAAAGVPCVGVFIGTHPALLVPQHPQRARTLDGQGQAPDAHQVGAAAQALLALTDTEPVAA